MSSPFGSVTDPFADKINFSTTKLPDHFVQNLYYYVSTSVVPLTLSEHWYMHLLQHLHRVGVQAWEERMTKGGILGGQGASRPKSG